MRGFFFPIIAILILSGCTPTETNRSSPTTHPADTLGIELPEEARGLDNLTVYPVDNPPESNIILEEEAHFGNTKEVFLGHIQPQNILIDEQGRVFLGDGGWGYRGIHVYAHDGSFIKTMGGGGKGPGEFLNATNMGFIGNELHLFDRDMDRINVYSLDNLKYSHAQILDPQKWTHIEEIQTSYLMHFYFRSDGNYLAGFVDQVNPELSEEDRLIRYYLMNQDGEIISEKLLEQHALKFIRTQTARFNLDHSRRSLFKLIESDEMVGAWTEDFLVKRFDSEGNYQSAIYYPFQRQAIDEHAIVTRFDDVWENNPEGIQMYKDRIRNATLPEEWPALNSMILDDEGRIWISTVDNYRGSFTWWILDENGRLISRFTRPQNHTVAAVKNGHAYILIEEGGGEEVVRYRISIAPYGATPQETQ